MNEVGGLSTAGLRRFKPYSKYIESGVRSIGKIPFHWQVTPLKYSSVINPDVLPEETNPDFSFKYLDISGVDSIGRIGETEMVRFENAPSRARRRVQLGDTIISTVRTYLKAIALIDETSKHLIVSTGFSVVRPSDKVDSRFLWRAVQSQYFVQLVVAYSAGISYPAISPSRLARIPIVLPAHEEEGPIVEFLDRETAKIDALIGKKERLIELLQEKRTSIITHAVTKGLESNAPLKSSGVAWIKAIPDHWDIRQNGLLFNERDEKGFPDLPILNVSINRGVTIREFSTEHIEQQAEDRSVYQRARAGDIAFNKMRMWQGAVGVAPIDGLVSPDYTVAVPNSKVNSKYFEALFRTSPYKTEINRYSHGIVPDRNRLYWDDFKQIKSVVPPLEEQNAIVEFIGNETARINRLISKVTEGIERLKEYRTALISAAVTGKIDVRDEVTSHSDS